MVIYHFNWCVIDYDQIELFILLIIVTATALLLPLRGKLCHNLPSFGGISPPWHLVVRAGVREWTRLHGSGTLPTS